MYRPSGEKLRKLSSSSGLMPRAGAAGSVARTRFPDGPTRRHALLSMYVSSWPLGLNAYRPESKPLAYVASTVAVPPFRLAVRIWLSEVSYATVDPLTNCGASAAASNAHRFRACAGSWMSRTTTVASPATVPMTRLSPAGTAVVQWTSDPIPVDGAGVPPPDGVDESVAVELEGDGETCPPVDPEPPHAASVRIAIRAAPLARTQVTVAVAALTSTSRGVKSIWPPQSRKQRQAATSRRLRRRRARSERSPSCRKARAPL